MIILDDHEMESIIGGATAIEYGILAVIVAATPIGQTPAADNVPFLQPA